MLSDSTRLVNEADALTERLFNAWWSLPRGDQRAVRLNVVSRRAFRRLWRRRAAAGDARAHTWMTQLEAVQEVAA